VTAPVLPHRGSIANPPPAVVSGQAGEGGRTRRADFRQAIERSLLIVGQQMTAQVYGLDRDSMRFKTPRVLRLYKRELDAMTVDEIESALLGHNAWMWEPLGDEAAQAPTAATGLEAWLP